MASTPQVVPYAADQNVRPPTRALVRAEEDKETKQASKKKPWECGDLAVPHACGAIYYYRQNKEGLMVKSGLYYRDQKICCKGCVSGHRSTICLHAGERDLYFVRKSGRPASCPCRPCPILEHQDANGKPRCECITCEICERKLALTKDPNFKQVGAASTSSSTRRGKAAKGPKVSRAKAKASKAAQAAKTSEALQASSSPEIQSGTTRPASGAREAVTFDVDTTTMTDTTTHEYQIENVLKYFRPAAPAFHPPNNAGAPDGMGVQVLPGNHSDLQNDGALDSSSSFDFNSPTGYANMNEEDPTMNVEAGHAFQPLPEDALANLSLFPTARNSSSLLSSPPILTPETPFDSAFGMAPLMPDGPYNFGLQQAPMEPYPAAGLVTGNFYSLGGQSIPEYGAELPSASTSNPVQQHLSSPAILARTSSQSSFPSDPSFPSPFTANQHQQSQQFNPSCIAPQMLHNGFDIFEPQTQNLFPSLQQHLPQLDMAVRDPAMSEDCLMAHNLSALQPSAQDNNSLFNFSDDAQDVPQNGFWAMTSF